MDLYKRILSYVKPYLHVLFAALLCTMLAAAGNLYLPWIFRDMIDKVLSAKDAYMLNMISAVASWIIPPELRIFFPKKFIKYRTTGKVRMVNRVSFQSR